MMANKICETDDTNVNNNRRAMAINNNNNPEENIKEENFMADMVEVRVQMYSCRVCGIRYDNMEAMKQHYNDVHPTIASIEEDSSTLKLDHPIIKQEILDDDDEEEMHQYQVTDDEHIGADGDDVGGYVLIDDHGQHIQVVQIENSDENGEPIVLQVINPDEEGQELLENNDQPVVERRKTRQQTANEAINNNQNNIDEKPAPKKRGRKRKSETAEAPAPKQPKPTLPIPTLISTRPRRMVVPNIKSEFIYAGISGSVETPVTTPKTTTTRKRQTTRQPEYTFVQESSGMLTAYKVSHDENDETNTVKNPKMEMLDSQELPVKNDFNIDEDGEDLLENGEEIYPTEYTPTSKTAKGRQRPEMNKGDEHLRRFPCPFQGCNYVAKYRSNLWDHKKTHTGEKPYVCNWPSCTMRFSQTHQLKLHLRSHTGERPYVCDWPGCNSAFSQKPGLKSHMLTHTGEKPFKCDYPGCGWTFRLKGALTDHKRAIHENAKKHICEWPGCNKRFLQQCHLKKHIMGHADIKPFSCDWPDCNYKAVTMAYVTNHRKTHTGEKNYECTFPNCNKRFVKSSHVNRHRQRCHPELFLYENEDAEEDANNNVEDTNGAVESIDNQTSNNNEENVNYLNGDANNNNNNNNTNGNDNSTNENDVEENESFVTELLELKQEKIDD